MRDYMNELILKEGYIQVGDGIPVYFRITPSPDWPVHIIFCAERYGQYDVYNEWIEKDYSLFEKLKINNIIKAGFEHSYCAFKNLINILNFTISDYYYHQRCGIHLTYDQRQQNNIKEKFYENLYNASRNIKTVSNTDKETVQG